MRLNPRWSLSMLRAENLLHLSIMPTSETTIENLERIARLMNLDKTDVGLYEKLGVLVRVNSKEYRIRKDQQIMILAEIEHDGEPFAYFMT